MSRIIEYINLIKHEKMQCYIPRNHFEMYKMEKEKDKDMVVLKRTNGKKILKIEDFKPCEKLKKFS